MSIGDSKCIYFTTYRKSGEPVSSPVWVTPLDDGRIGFWTSSTSGKYKRLRHNPQVTVQPCDMRGRLTPGTEPSSATAATITSGPEFDAVQRQIKAKYSRVMIGMSRLGAKIGSVVKRKPQPYGDVVVVVTLDAA